MAERFLRLSDAERAEALAMEDRDLTVVSALSEGSAFALRLPRAVPQPS